MESYKLLSHAKVNFGLRIINKREDGFHNLETIFFPIKLSDKISVSISHSATDHNSVTISSNDPVIPLNESNICFKALEYFLLEFRIFDKLDVKINIEKKIPVGGGLGGGSSNAASVLRSLVKFFSIDVSQNRKRVLSIALKVGSDVPFFLVGKPCFAEGRGEMMKILPEFKLDGYDLVVVNPGLHVSTKWAFETLILKQGEVRESEISKMTKFSLENVAFLINDFEDIVFKRFPLLKEIKSIFTENGAVYSSLSGTGASIFGVFNKGNKKDRQEMLSVLRQKNYFVYEQNC